MAPRRLPHPRAAQPARSQVPLGPLRRGGARSTPRLLGSLGDAACRFTRPGLDAGWFHSLGSLRGARVESARGLPHSIFSLLAGGERLPKKSTPSGADKRKDVLSRAGLLGVRKECRTHDLLDAAAAALVALEAVHGDAVEVTCTAGGRDHDGSAMWLPAEPHTAPTTSGGRRFR